MNFYLINLFNEINYQAKKFTNPLVPPDTSQYLLLKNSMSNTEKPSLFFE